MSDSIETKLDMLWEMVHGFSHRLNVLAAVCEHFGRKLAGTHGEEATRLREAIKLVEEDLRPLRRACRDILRTPLPVDQPQKRQTVAFGNTEAVKVLWVDDDALQMSHLRSQFDDAKWDLTVATSVEKALELLHANSFDGVMIDQMMPPGSFSNEETAGGQKTGVVLARHTRDKHPSMPIVFLTIANTPDLFEWCRRNPPALVLFKPQIDSDAVRQADHLIRYHTDGRLDDLEDLLKRFPRFVNALTHRHSNRPGFELADEYDVQDLLRGLLLFTLSDVREEEWTPSYVGASSRIDFVLPLRQTAIEVKMTRRGMSLKDLGDQLVIDIARYRAHPDVKSVICFIVDAAGIVLNRDGLIRDLRASSSETLEVRAVICDVQPQTVSPVRSPVRRRQKKDRPV